MDDAQRVARPDGRLAYQIVGPDDGPLVIAVPGLGDLRAEYRFLAKALAESGFRVAMLDLRGHGESDTSFADHSAAAVGRDIIALMEHLGAQRAHIIGTSMAAAAAVFAAAEAPTRVDRIVLIGPFVRDIPVSPLLRLAMRALFARPWGPWAWSWYYGTLYPTRAPADLAAYRQTLTANLRERGRLEALQHMLASSKADCEARLVEVRAKSLIVMGTLDPDFPDPGLEARVVAERLGGDIALIAGAGHYPHVEMPELVAPRIASFLAGATEREEPEVSRA